MHRYSSEYRRFLVGFTLALAIPTLSLAAGSPAHAAALGTSLAPMIVPVPHAPLTDLGRAARTTRVNVTLALNYRNPAQLDAVIAATADPASPEFGHFLTPAQFTAAFAPTATEYARVTSTLVRAGFAITRNSPTRMFVKASAPAAVAERFFNTTLHAVKQSGVGTVRYANATPAALPAALRDVTFGVAGVSNLVVAKVGNVRAAAHRPDLALGLPLQGPDTGLSPYALATAYDFPVQHQRPGAKAGKTYDGTGHAAGIAIDSDMLDSDLSSFLAYFNITRTGPPLARVSVDGGASINFDGDETTLDAETISGLAPGAAVSLYLMPDLSTPSIVDTYAQVVEDDKVEVLNSSFGGCELADNLGALSDHIAKQGNAEGITFSASSGDDGSDTCFGFTASGLGVSAPASAPHFTAVGGTSLIVTTAGAYHLELTWDGSGGGVSTVFALPSYQKGVKNAITSGRNVPDIAFDANPGTGESWFYEGAFNGPIGGTSLSSPIFCALVLELNEKSGKHAGWVDPALYSAFQSTGYKVMFRDITLGNNNEFGVGGYNAMAGYDDVTGIGSLIGTPYAK